MPERTVIPVLTYSDVNLAVAWLCQAFGFRLWLRIGNHRAQLTIGDGAIVVTRGKRDSREIADSIMVRVDNANEHYECALRHGARLLSAVADYPYGERQYSVEDMEGHRWTFSQTIADIDPEDWGGMSGEPVLSSSIVDRIGPRKAESKHEQDGRGRQKHL